MPLIDIVVPCYNEEAGLRNFVEVTNSVIDTLPQYDFRYILVNDGSKDKTYLVMKELANKYDNVKYISFSRNFGKEAAMFAGFQHTTGDYVIVMDADLQHPPQMFPQMIDEVANKGYDCCALQRTAREGESKFRGVFSKLFFRLQNAMSDVKMPYGAVDYRIMTRQMVDSIIELSEVQRFSKGLFSWVGFNTKWLPFQTVDRELGTTTWSFWKLFKYALDGITSFSIAPLRFISVMGIVIFFIAFIYIIITLIQTIIFGIDVPGYATTLMVTLFMGGIMEFSIGILGEYLGRVFIESKDRPIYIIHHTNFDEDKSEEDKQ
ncbi:MAG: glycosyltransferase family 2 protein [Oscillospiraceae bacterium]|nr:glycosyltransferase family 2 protein [Oscillospiraceae bacterium]